MSLHVYYLVMDTRAFDKAMGTAAILILIIIVINAGMNYFTHRVAIGLGRRL
jgi:ABC-type phosphate transport system permease subunit